MAPLSVVNGWEPLDQAIHSASCSQSHINDGFFKLVEAMLQIYSCFFSHSMKLYVGYRYQQCHCLGALPAKMSVFNSHMQVSLSVLPNTPKLHTKETHIRTIKTHKAHVTNKNI